MNRHTSRLGVSALVAGIAISLFPPRCADHSAGKGGRTFFDKAAAAGLSIAWLRTLVTERPRSGNTLMVTHQPNITRAFPDAAADVAEGEAIVFQPDGKGGVKAIGRIPIDVWPRLSATTKQSSDRRSVRHCPPFQVRISVWQRAERHEDRRRW